MKNLTIVLYKREDFSQAFKLLRQGSHCDFILGFKEISRLFSMNYEEMKELAQQLKKFPQVRLFLQWDILMTESRFQSIFTRLKQSGLLESDLFAALRVQDPGALYALREYGVKKKIHFIVEQGNHNTLGLKSWLNFWPSQIERMVLSPELPARALVALKKELSCEIEILGLGPILLFYSPRQLVSPLYGDAPEGRHDVLGTSEESPHKGFPIVENEHGTFMFNTKDQFLFDEEEAIRRCEGLHWRCDFVFGVGALDLVSFAKEYQGERKLGDYKEDYGRPVTKGFFRVNKTDVLFKKLKNYRLQDRGKLFLGEVVDVKKKEHIALLIKAPQSQIRLGDRLRFLSPEGREKEHTIKSMKDAIGNNIMTASTGEIIFINPVGGLSVKSMAFNLSRD